MFNQIKQGLTLLYLIIFSSSQGQTVYFDSRFDTLGYVEHIKKTFPENDGYSFVFEGYSPINSFNSSICYRKVDLEGIEVNGFCFYFDSLFFWDSWVDRDEDGNIVIFGIINSQNDSFSNDGIGFYKFNPNGIVLDSNQYYLSGTNYRPKHFLFLDDGYIVVGQASFDSEGDMFLVKLDTNGNVLFEKRYGGSLYEAAMSLVQTPDRGFLLLGWTRSFGNGQRDWYLVKTDSLGNQEWQKTYGNSNNQSGWGIIALKDSNYLMSGGAGNVIWQKDYSYDGSESNYLNWPLELMDGNIVAVGLTTNAAESNAGYLLKTDSMGNEIWQQKYNVSTYPDLFYDVLPTADGGFLLSGMCHPNTQDGWLLKVDSLGCPYPNCTVGIEEKSKKIAFNLWPNPAVNELHNELYGSAGAKFVLRDAIGRVVLQKTLNEKENTIDLSSIPAGIYNAEIDIGKEKYFKKLIIAKE